MIDCEGRIICCPFKPISLCFKLVLVQILLRIFKLLLENCTSRKSNSKVRLVLRRKYEINELVHSLSVLLLLIKDFCTISFENLHQSSFRTMSANGSKKGRPRIVHPSSMHRRPKIEGTSMKRQQTNIN